VETEAGAAFLAVLQLHAQFRLLAPVDPSFLSTPHYRLKRRQKSGKLKRLGELNNKTVPREMEWILLTPPSSSLSFSLDIPHFATVACLRNNCPAQYFQLAKAWSFCSSESLNSTSSTCCDFPAGILHQAPGTCAACEAWRRIQNSRALPGTSLDEDGELQCDAVSDQKMLLQACLVQSNSAGAQGGNVSGSVVETEVPQSEAKRRIAVCYSGHLREFSLTWPTHRDFLFKPLQDAGLEVSVFYSANSNSTQDNRRSQNGENFGSKIDDAAFKQMVGAALPSSSRVVRISELQSSGAWATHAGLLSAVACDVVPCSVVLRDG